MEPLVEVSVSGAADRPRPAELGVLTWGGLACVRS
jgi:hypothetical protein